jgi:methionyl-tRNA synthetase
VPDAEIDPQLADGGDGIAGIDATVRALLDRAELTQALEVIWSRVRRLNRYVEESRPWDLAKDDGADDRLDQVLYNLVEGLRVMALLLCPYMPNTSGLLLDALAEERRELDAFGARGGGARVQRIEPLFPKLEPA